MIGVVPAVAYAATSKLPYDFDEYRLLPAVSQASPSRSFVARPWICMFPRRRRS